MRNSNLVKFACIFDGREDSNRLKPIESFKRFQSASIGSKASWNVADFFLHRTYLSWTLNLFHLDWTWKKKASRSRTLNPADVEREIERIRNKSRRVNINGKWKKKRKRKKLFVKTISFIYFVCWSSDVINSLFLYANLFVWFRKEMKLMCLLLVKVLVSKRVLKCQLKA